MNKISLFFLLLLMPVFISSSTFGANSKDVQEAPMSQIAKKPDYGLYRAAGCEGEIADIVIHSDGTGSFEFEEESNPFTWKMQGNKIIITMLDTSLPPEQRTYEGTLKNDNSLVMDDLTYKREKEIKIETYDYLEKGFSGSLYLTDWDSKGEQVNIRIATVNDASTNTCDAEVTCKSKDTMLLCKDRNSEDPEAILTIKFEDKDILLVDGKLSRSEYCGNGGDFFGKYKLFP